MKKRFLLLGNFGQFMIKVNYMPGIRKKNYHQKSIQQCLAHENIQNRDWQVLEEPPLLQ